MSSLIEHVERAETARWEAVFREDLVCEGPWHPLGKGGHDDGPAAFVVICRSCGHRALFCAARVAAILSSPETVHCSVCKTWPAPLRFIEL